MKSQCPRLANAHVASVTYCILLIALAATSARAATDDAEDTELQDYAAEVYASKYRLTLDEAHRRLGIQDAAGGLDDELAALLGAQFAGVWFDSEDAGRLKIALTPSAASLEGEISKLTEARGLRADTRFVAVRYSIADLERIQSGVRDSLADLIRAGHARTSYNPKTNTVAVTALAQLAPGEEARIKALQGTPGVQVARVAGSTLNIDYQACNITYCNPPLRGGREIQGPMTCTAAFTARHRVHQSHLLLVTVGHCLLFSPWTDIWESKNEANDYKPIGNPYGWVFAGGPGIDAGVIRINDNSYWMPPQPVAQVVVKTSANTTYDPEYTIKYDSLSSIGLFLCYTGRTTGTHCGEVEDLGVDVVGPINGVNYVSKHLGQLDICGTQDGDSGGPIYKKHRAYGIVVGNDGCDTYYQGIRGAENALNIDILLSP